MDDCSNVKKHLYRGVVFFSDVDMMHIVNNATYYQYFERARVSLLKEAGLSYSVVMEKGYDMATVKSGAEFKAPLTFEEEYIIEVHCSYLRNSSAKIIYTVKNKDGKVCCSGFSIHASLKNMEIVDLPEDLRVALMPYTETKGAINE